MKKFEIFLSYCWGDEETAEKIEAVLAKNVTINLHRDKIDIGSWKSIKEYMHSISKMDYTILLISDAYLKSSNCMFEVLEVMRDIYYNEKIFPVVINSGIYKPAIRAEYVKYWQKEYKDLKDILCGIELQNLGRLGDDLKRAQNISANIAEFLDMVSDMNNPAIGDVCAAIEDKLVEKKFINIEKEKNQGEKLDSWTDFIIDNLSVDREKLEITDYKKNQFMSESFQQVNDLMNDLIKKLENEYSCFQVTAEKNDSRNYIYQFYKSGKLIRGIRIFLCQDWGEMSIKVSTDFYSMGSNINSWNGMYVTKNKEGKLYLTSQFSYTNKEEMSSEDVVKDIWINYIKPYINV